MHRMRSIICTDYKGKLYRFVWMDESPRGIYLGWYDSSMEVHVSYHTDGKHHIKFRKKTSEADSRIDMADGAPIQKIDKTQQIMSTVLFYKDDIFRRLSPFRHDKRAKAVILLNGILFQGIEALSLNVVLIHSNSEKSFLSDMYESYQNKSFDLVAVNLLRLENFPNHKVALVFYRGKVTLEKPSE